MSDELKPKHSPAPWRLTTDDRLPSIITGQVSSNGKVMVLRYGTEKADGFFWDHGDAFEVEAEANIKVALASPDLLTAADKAVTLLTKLNQATPQDVTAVLDALVFAIIKATGGGK